MDGSMISDRGERRLAILAAAQEVFAEYGFHKAKVETIAERASIAKGTVYLYFSSKKDLLRALVEERMERLSQLVEMQTSEKRDLMTTIKGLIKAHFLFYLEEREFIAILYGQLGQIAEGMEEPAKRASERMTGLISELLEPGIEQGLLRAMSSRRLAQVLQGMIHAMAFDWAVRGGDESPEELSQQVYQLFCCGALIPAALSKE
ncbi:MAG: TetR/AcrR family transcriptional regulator [Limnochordia bacterium]